MKYTKVLTVEIKVGDKFPNIKEFEQKVKEEINDMVDNFAFIYTGDSDDLNYKLKSKITKVKK